MKNQSSPYLNQFTQPDTIIPNLSNPQSWNRFSYVQNSPIGYNDSTGHQRTEGGDTPTPTDPDDYLSSDEEDAGATSPTGPPCPLCDVQSDSGASNGINGPLPDDIVNTLVSQGADPEMLGDVVLISNPSDINWQFSCSGSFNRNVIARTHSNNIYWCMPQYFDSDVPTPVLLHELVHVAQYGKYPDDVDNEQRQTSMFTVRDIIGGLLNRKWEKYNPYESSWVEVQGANCQVAFTNDPSIRLDRPPCNIWISLP